MCGCEWRPMAWLSCVGKMEWRWVSVFQLFHYFYPYNFLFTHFIYESLHIYLYIYFNFLFIQNFGLFFIEYTVCIRLLHHDCVYFYYNATYQSVIPVSSLEDCSFCRHPCIVPIVPCLSNSVLPPPPGAFGPPCPLLPLPSYYKCTSNPSKSPEALMQ